MRAAQTPHDAHHCEFSPRGRISFSSHFEVRRRGAVTRHGLGWREVSSVSHTRAFKSLSNPERRRAVTASGDPRRRGESAERGPRCWKQKEISVAPRLWVLRSELEWGRVQGSHAGRVRSRETQSVGMPRGGTVSIESESQLGKMTVSVPQ